MVLKYISLKIFLSSLIHRKTRKQPLIKKDNQKLLVKQLV